MKPYLSFEVDGLRAQTLCPLPGRHWYNVFLGLNGEKPHQVRVIRETQPFVGDPEAFVTLLRLRTDGEVRPLPAPAHRLVFIGDSLTSGEGGRGPVSFLEWVPMVFCASDNYARMTADAMNAEYQVISQSGWGVVGSWDNHPDCALPLIYDWAELPSGSAPWDFSFRPDHIIVALGANDENAIAQPACTDPATGKAFHLDGTAEATAGYRDACAAFLRHLHEKDPQARITWIGLTDLRHVGPAIREAVAICRAEGLPVSWLEPLSGFRAQPRDSRGSRQHPGIGFHRRAAAQLAKALSADEG